MALPASSRTRILALWALFAVGAIAAVIAVQRLYSRAQREVAEQAERAQQAALQRAQTRAQEESDALRLGTIRSLAGMHVDGLGAVLRRWDESNAHVIGVFLWESNRGFVVSTGNSPVGVEELLKGSTAEFQQWRSDHHSIGSRGATRWSGWRIEMVRTLDNAALTAGGLGYQEENLEILSHAGRAVDPWAAWAVNEKDPRAPWVFWYRPGPDAPVRGCYVEPATRLDRLRAEWRDTEVVRFEIIPPNRAAEGVELAGFPNSFLRASVGAVFERKRSDVLWNAAVVALLLALCLLGGSALAWHTRRVSREAERQLTFVAQVSHELRTPLTSIRMFADLLGAPEIALEKRQKFADTISRESARLGGLIERLLTFNALEHGKRTVTCAPVDVAKLAHETAEEMSGVARAAGLQLVLELPESPLVAHAEASAVKQALVNLVDNAAKYAVGGSVVKISGTADARSVRLTVADDGPGVPAEIRDRVFDPFVQGNRSMTDKTPGIGLGLSIARGLLRQGGGDLVLLASSTGATFELRLPRATSATPTELPATPAGQP